MVMILLTLSVEVFFEMLDDSCRLDITSRTRTMQIAASLYDEHVATATGDTWLSAGDNSILFTDNRFISKLDVATITSCFCGKRTSRWSNGVLHEDMPVRYPCGASELSSGSNQLSAMGAWLRRDLGGLRQRGWDEHHPHKKIWSREKKKKKKTLTPHCPTAKKK